MRKIFLAFIAVFIINIVASAENKKNMPNNEQILFIVNYMDVFGLSSLRGARTAKSFDFFPLLRLEGSREATNEQEIRAMVKYGFNALQVWPDYRAAAKWLKTVEKMDLPEKFYVFPQIAGIAHVFFPTYEDFVKGTVDFLKEYGNHPNLLHIDGLPVLSSWGNVKYLKDFKKFKRDVNRHGIDFYWLPSLDTAVKHPNMKKLAVIRDKGYPALNSWRNLSCPVDIEKVRALLNANGRKCRIFGTITPGYDNRNRMFMDNYRVYDGAKTYINYLNAGLKCNLKELIMVTWNDVHETASMPSWRSPGGFEEITRFYRGIYDGTGSPYKDNRVIVVYQPEQLLGDMIRVQFILLPGQTGSNWTGTLELRDIDDRTVFSRQINLNKGEGNRAVIENIDFPSLKLENDSVMLSPYIISGREQKRLSPIYIMVDRARSKPPLLIPLNRIADKVTADLKFAGSNKRILKSINPAMINADIQSTTKIRQLQLADSTQILLDAEITTADKTLLFPVFDNWGFNSKFEVTLHNAEFRWSRQHPGKGSSQKTCISRLNGNTLQITPNSGTGFKGETPFIVTAIQCSDPDKASMTIRELKPDGNSINLKISELGIKPAELLNKQGILRIRLAEDGHSLSELSPLNTARVKLTAMIPNIDKNEPFRSIFCEGELVNGKVFYSRPLLWIRSKTPDHNVDIQILDTGKAFDETLLDGSTVSVNDFKPEQIRRLSVPAWRLPLFNFNFNEGRGWYVNDGGGYNSRGFGWRVGVSSRKSKWGAPDKDDPQWIPKGLKDSAMIFKPNSKLGLRSGTMPSGAFSFLCWIKPDKPLQNGLIFSDSHFSIMVDGHGKIIFKLRKDSRSSSQTTSKATIKPGIWQQLAVTYDLSEIRIYLNGKLDRVNKQPPLQSRLHSLPFFGAADAKRKSFSGTLDEAFFTGRAISAKEVEKDFRDHTREVGNVTLRAAEQLNP